jgi:hypothetical protein
MIATFGRGLIVLKAFGSIDSRGKGFKVQGSMFKVTLSGKKIGKGGGNLLIPSFGRGCSKKLQNQRFFVFWH